MAKVILEAAPRTEFGKGASRRLRRDGRVPAVVYGTDFGPAHISVPGHDLMMALKHSGVVLEVEIAGQPVNVAPRQVQKDPVTRDLEHVDLLVLSQKEVRERLVVGAAIAKAEQVAAEEELDAVSVVNAVRELLDEGVDPDEAISRAIENVKEDLVTAAAAAAAAADAEEAKEAAAADESGEGASADGAAGGSASSE